MPSLPYTTLLWGRSNSTSLADAKAALVDAQLALKNTPQNLVIVGAGPVGVEYAGGQILSNLSFGDAMFLQLITSLSLVFLPQRSSPNIPTRRSPSSKLPIDFSRILSR